MNNGKPKVLVIGDVMLDRYWFGSVERMSPEAPVPVLRMDRVEDRLGGAANVAANLASLGADVTLAGLIGQDEAGEKLVHLLREAGVQWEGMATAGVRTTLKVRHVTSHQHLLRCDFEERPHPECIEVFTSKVAIPLLRGHETIVLSDYAKGSLDQVQEIIAASTGRVLIDPKGADWSRYRGAWLLKPNEAEMAAAYGRWSDAADLQDLADRVRARNQIANLLLTKGDRGSVLFNDAGATITPAAAREVFDVCGAGDTTLAAFAFATAKGRPPEEAARFGTAAAGVAVGHFGTATVRLHEIDQA